MDRCETHRTALVIDPLRGPICPHCDAEAVASMRLPWRRWLWRLMRWLRL